nr:U11/U12 small nuclear ribonucleoprotein 48 kDa protein isoform X2 [Bombyx mori]
MTCKYDSNHRIPSEKLEIHENKCRLKSLGYDQDQIFLPEPLDPDSKTVVKLNREKITDIINKAANSERLFKRGQGPEDSEPLTVERLQSTYTCDERRAIHDAVVGAAPTCHDLSDLALPSTSGEGEKSKESKSRVEILAELRDMKRRRTKYRVAAKTQNFSAVLRDVIKTQMELYIEARNGVTRNKNNDKTTENGTNAQRALHGANSAHTECGTHYRDRGDTRAGLNRHNTTAFRHGRPVTRADRPDMPNDREATRDVYKKHTRERHEYRDTPRRRDDSRNGTRQYYNKESSHRRSRSRDRSKSERYSRNNDHTRRSERRDGKERHKKHDSDYQYKRETVKRKRL